MCGLLILSTFNPIPSFLPGEQEWEAIEAAQSAQGVASDGLESGVGSIMKDLMTSVPGIDEAMAFAELMKMVRLYSLSLPPIRPYIPISHHHLGCPRCKR